MMSELTRTPSSTEKMSDIDNEADDVIVDGEEESLFGPSQYSESDVKHCKK